MPSPQCQRTEDKRKYLQQEAFKQQISTNLRNAHENATTILPDVEVKHLIFNSHRLWLRQPVQTICSQAETYC